MDPYGISDNVRSRQERFSKNVVSNDTLMNIDIDQANQYSDLFVNKINQFSTI